MAKNGKKKFKASHYDIIFYDTIGNAYSRSILKLQPSGAAEIAVCKYAHWFAEQGFSVLVLNALAAPETDGAVTYDHFDSANGLRCKALVLVRYSKVPNIEATKTVVWSVDADSRCHEHQRSIKTIITLSPWHASLFRGWDMHVIPSALPDHVYQPSEAPRNPAQFVYCSSVIKGLPMTLNAWSDFKRRRTELKDAELLITTPGYDLPDLEHIARTPGAKYLGDLQHDRLETLLRGVSGMFFVNSFPETFCLAAVLAETVGCHPHIFFHADPGAIPWTVRSTLPTNDAKQFEEDLVRRVVEMGPRSVPNDFRMSRVMPQWLQVLGLSVSDDTICTQSQTVCLVMIVSEKTDPEAIKRCVKSCLRVVSVGCVVVDPGSKMHDSIKEAFGEIPVHIHEEPWVHFGHNRSLAIEHAKGLADYNLMIDADDSLEFEPWFQLPHLNRDHYDIVIKDLQIEYWRSHIFKNDSDYYYEGAMHEHLAKKTPHGFIPKLYGMNYRRTAAGTDGARHDKAIEALAPNPRSAFYYAQELKDSGRYQDAMHAYAVRAAMTSGFWEEVFIALMEVARCHVRLNYPAISVEVAYACAYEHRKERAPEVMTELAWYLMDRKQWMKAYKYACLALFTPFPTQDMLFVERAPYDWKLKDACAIAAYWTGEKAHAEKLNRELLDCGFLPMDQVQRVQTNLEFCQR